ncbi:MAG: hypothetical protein Q7T26_06550 [Dehalococcoidia bacterium]|nr:hypothetical protein [Dehalococcoidia bacterium]
MNASDGPAAVYHSLDISPDDMMSLLSFDSYRAQTGSPPEARLSYAGMARQLHLASGAAPTHATREQVQGLVQALLGRAGPDTREGVVLLALHLRSLLLYLGNEPAACALDDMAAPSEDTLVRLPGWLAVEARERLFWTPARLDDGGPAIFRGTGAREKTPRLRVGLVEQARIVWVMAGTTGATLSWALITESIMGSRVRMRGTVAVLAEQTQQHQAITGMGEYALQLDTQPGIRSWWVAVEEYRPPKGSAPAGL